MWKWKCVFSMSVIANITESVLPSLIVIMFLHFFFVCDRCRNRDSTVGWLHHRGHGRILCSAHRCGQGEVSGPGPQLRKWFWNQIRRHYWCLQEHRQGRGHQRAVERWLLENMRIWVWAFWNLHLTNSVSFSNATAQFTIVSLKLNKIKLKPIPYDSVHVELVFF